MGKTGPVLQAVEANEIVVTCAYEGWVEDEVKAALPPGFNAKSFVAKFVGGELVALESGHPEEAILKLLGKPAPLDCTDCKDCEACPPEPSISH